MNKRGYLDDDDEDDDFPILLAKKSRYDDLSRKFNDDSLEDILPPTMEPSPIIITKPDKNNDKPNRGYKSTPQPTWGISDDTGDEFSLTQDPKEEKTKEDKELSLSPMHLEQQVTATTFKSQSHFPELETMVPQMQTLSSRLLCLETLPETRSLEVPNTTALNLDSPPPEEQIVQDDNDEDPITFSSPELKPIFKKQSKKVTFADKETAVQKYEKIRETMTQQVLSSSYRETIQPTLSDDVPQFDFRQAAIKYRIQCAVLRQKLKTLTEGNKL